MSAPNSLPQKPQQAEKPSQPFEQPGLAGPQQVVMQARYLIERTAFVGHSFAESDADVVTFFKSLLGEMATRCLSGEAAEAKSISDKVKERIKQAELFVAIFTRRDKIEGKEEWSTAPWVIEEKAHAQALGKKLILLKESGIAQIGGMQGDLEYIEFKRDALHHAAIRLIQTIWSLNPSKMTLSRNMPFPINQDLLDAAIAAHPEEPSLRLALAQVHASAGRHDAAVRELQTILSTYPNFGQARSELSKALQQMGKDDEAATEVDHALKSNPFWGDAHHQKAHCLERASDIGSAISEFRTAINCEPGKANNYRCLGKLLFRVADNLARVREAKEALETAIKLGDDAVGKECRPFLEAVEKKSASLAKPNPTKSQRGKKKRSFK
jgi:tetratricopeptide (TPR) repeat protein